jgi:predicted DNA-binding transcriptional regulator AlpA
LEGITLLTARQMAELLGVHVRSVWRMSQAGQIPPPIRMAERVVRWRLADLQVHLDGIASGGKAVRR